MYDDQVVIDTPTDFPNGKVTDRVAGEIETVRQPSPWRRFWTSLQTYAEAFDTSYDEIQDRRIAALEAEVARLRMLAPIKT
jgi:hypothetical protein